MAERDALVDGAPSRPPTRIAAKTKSAPSSASSRSVVVRNGPDRRAPLPGPRARARRDRAAPASTSCRTTSSNGCRRSSAPYTSGTPKAAAPDDRELHAARISAIPAAESSALGRNPEARARREAGTVVAAVPAGGEHDGRRVLVAGELLADLEPVEIGELHVQQDEVGAQLSRGCDGAEAVLGFADDVVPLELEEPARRRPEGGVIVDDENACSHRGSVGSLPVCPRWSPCGSTDGQPHPCMGGYRRAL